MHAGCPRLKLPAAWRRAVARPMQAATERRAPDVEGRLLLLLAVLRRKALVHCAHKQPVAREVLQQHRRQAS